LVSFDLTGQAAARDGAVPIVRGCGNIKRNDYIPPEARLW
jgi:hypothetical protein